LSFKPTILSSVSTFGSMYVTILSSFLTGYSRLGFVQAFYLQVRQSLFSNTCSRSNASLMCQYKNVKADVCLPSTHPYRRKN
jgi:hypothetical protein